MSIELVTGFAGKAHIDSLDHAKFNAAVVGSGSYVFSGLGDGKLKATMTSSNRVHIASGNGMIQGRHYIVDASGVDLTVQTGTQGQKRNDLVVARYSKNASSGIEDVSLVVIKGTPTTGTPTDPAYNKGDILNGSALVADMPLWRIPLNGITVGAPVQLFEEFSSAKQFRDSVSQKLWTGTLGRGGSVTVPGLSGAKVIGLRFRDGNGTVHPLVLQAGETTFGVAETGGTDTYDIVSFYGKLTVTGNIVSCGQCYISVARSNGLGQPFVLVSGDGHTIVEIWRIA